ncbi:MAG: hypothetical protein Q4G39_03110 [Brachymonas sp.]|nr:hypothetical protein [Brachymonas sp.]
MQRSASPPASPGNRTLFGLLTFDEPLLCARETLGATAPILIGGVGGICSLPRLPDWSELPDDPLHAPLVPPEEARTWRQGSEPFAWGFPTSYPTGTGQVEMALLRFDVAGDSVSEEGARVIRGFDSWRTLFLCHLELLTKQRRIQQIRVQNKIDDLDLFCWSAENKPERPWDKEPTEVQIVFPSEDTFLKVSQFNRLCELASAGIELPLEYRIQLEAYRALAVGDFRKAIIEAGAAAEVALTSAICAKLSTDGITHGDELLGKFRTLGGRLNLAKKIGLQLPKLGISKNLVQPRNEVVHKADFADHRTAYLAIEVTDELIHMQPGALY